MEGRTVYLTKCNFDLFLDAIQSRKGTALRRAVVVDNEGPWYYDGPLSLKWDPEDGKFKLMCEGPGIIHRPEDGLDGWELKMDPWKRVLYLAVDGYYRITVHDTLTEASA